MAPFVYLLSRVPEPSKTRARDALIQKILKFLTIKRFFVLSDSFYPSLSPRVAGEGDHCAEQGRVDRRKQDNFFEDWF